MQWRLAKALEVLRSEVNAKWPGRSRESDGAVGDAAHASRASDHNPWITDPPGLNVVSAIDITHDPAGGCDSYALAEWLRQRRDPRIKYIISNRRIVSSEVSPWQWRPYHGANPHDHHMHVSVQEDKARYDDARPWGLADATVVPTAPSAPQPAAAPVTLREGAQGQPVRALQARLTGHGIRTEIDGVFGPATRAAVIRFQQTHGLVADGVVGPQTWKLVLV